MEDKFHCVVCNVKCSGIEPYMQHMSSTKHEKKVQQGKLNVTLGSSGSNFFCEVCNVPCSGVAPYQQHITSDKHLKKVQTAKFLTENSFSLGKADCPESAEKRGEGNGLASNTSGNLETNLSQISYKCQVCDKRFTGPVPYQIHMDSLVHQKNLKKAALLTDLNVVKDDLYGISKYSGVLDSDVSSTSNNNHNKNAEVSTPARSLSKSSSARTTPPQDYYFCSTCEKHFSGPVPFRQHMESPLHEKQVKRAALLGELKMDIDLSPGKNVALGVRDMAMNMPLAECYVCSKKLYSQAELQEHYDSVAHHDSQNVYDYKRKVRVFSPDEPFDLKV